MLRTLHCRAKTGLLAVALAAMALIPLCGDGTSHAAYVGLPGSAALTQHLTLVVGMVGAAIAREKAGCWRYLACML